MPSAVGLDSMDEGCGVVVALLCAFRAGLLGLLVCGCLGHAWSVLENCVRFLDLRFQGISLHAGHFSTEFRFNSCFGHSVFSIRGTLLSLPARACSFDWY